MTTPRPDGSQARIVDHLKRHGDASVAEVAAAFGLSVETIRSQMKSLVAGGWVVRRGARREGAGRPEIVYGLADAAEDLFPRRETDVLRGLAGFLRDEGQEDVLVRYLERSARERRQSGLARLEGLDGAERLRETARILSDEGYMAEVVEGAPDGRPRLRLCHCPLRNLVHVTAAPCRIEVGLVRALVGDKLTRVEYLPDGDQACTYAVGTGTRAS